MAGAIRVPASATSLSSQKAELQRVRTGDYGNTSEYLRDLIRRDQHAEAARRFRLLIADGLESGDSRPLTDEVVGELRGRALGTEV